MIFLERLLPRKLLWGGQMVRFVLPCQIVIPPIKTVGSTFFINVYTYPNPKPTPYSNADALNIVVQREKKDEILMCACAVSPGRKI